MPQFAGYEQHDVQEFIAFLLDAIHEDLNRYTTCTGVSSKKLVELREAKEGEAEEFVAMEAWKGYLQRNKSIIVDLFQGQLRSALQCQECGHQSVTFDPFMYLSLPMGDPEPIDPKPSSPDLPDRAVGEAGGGERVRPGEISLASCVRRFCEVEVLDGADMWYCPNCKKHRPATKRLDLWKVPPVLIIHFKRFEGRRKINDKVVFPTEGLDLSEVVKSPQKETPDYDLFATANHHGTMYGGHYTAFARSRQSGEWHQFNDESVSPSGVGDLQRNSAYVLFYAKMTTLRDPEGRKDQPDPCRRPGSSPGTLVSAFSGGGGDKDKDMDIEGCINTSSSSSSRRTRTVVRRQSVSKPYNWPHLASAEGMGPQVDPRVNPAPAGARSQGSGQVSV
ncbi:unnamed protein product [Discosporangium mesarthrocarpum]